MSCKAIIYLSAHLYIQITILTTHQLLTPPIFPLIENNHPNTHPQTSYPSHKHLVTRNVFILARPIISRGETAQDTPTIIPIPNETSIENKKKENNMNVCKMTGWYHISSRGVEADVYVHRGEVTRAKTVVDGVPTPARIYVSDSSGGWIPVASVPYDVLSRELGHAYELSPAIRT